MKTKFTNKLLLSSIVVSSMMIVNIAAAGILKVSDTDFNAGAGQITFSEFAVNTVNPFYTPTDYSGDISDPDVSFAGWFNGQMLSLNAAIDCPGAAASACIVGSPTGALGLDASSTDTFITTDGANPTSPVLSGTPEYNGGIAILFSSDQFGVGFDGGFFDAIGSTAITAFARDGSLIGSVANTVTGIEFLGLVTDDQTASIAGVFLDLVGAEPAGFAIDNIRFGGVDDIDVTGIPEPSTLLLLVPTLLGLRLLRKSK
ncbi:PEP-CTERM sorting domain-containing protein [uncultured Paraglaciecola sp.]|uniref:PEP-CTERM sorting domain-containing protein n=1 Tax=uncultured Paraglaciecola sp. TaxID=1765024 RepID=UPI0026369300|nr:PEP-CTERM sorting domain-containing protein [uncultured Paraglaciecola sp.]